MQIKSMHVQNFKCLQDCSISFETLTSIIGENNAGKSAFLKALKVFFGSETSLSSEDYFQRKVESPVLISVTFFNLTSVDKKVFGDHIIDEEVTISREFIFGESKKEAARFYAEANVFSGFDEIRAQVTDSSRKKLYEEFRRKMPSGLLPAGVKGADIEEHLRVWELNNLDMLSPKRKGRVFGFANVALGKLREATSFHLIPAVQDASVEIDSEKSSPVRQLISDVVRQTIENQKEFQAFKLDAAAKLEKLTSPANVPSLKKIGSELTSIVAKYYESSKITADITPISELPINFPKPKILVEDNDFVASIENLGHGLQRAVLMSVIEFLASHSISSEDAEKFSEVQSDIVIAIEEPEIYQHPVKQRLFSKALQKLCDGFNESNGIRFQVILVTHSPLFVDITMSQNIRSLRRVVTSDYSLPVVTGLSIEDCASKTAELLGRTANIEKYKRALHTFSYEISEGLFSKATILVEGESDKAFITGFLLSKGFDPLMKGVTIAATNGKTNLDKPISIFRSLNLDCYAVADNDEKEKRGIKNNTSINRLIQSLQGVAECDLRDYPSGYLNGTLFFSGNLESYVKSCVDQKLYRDVVQKLANEFDTPPSDCSKSPYFVSKLFEELQRSEPEFKHLNDLFLDLSSSLS